MEKHLIYEAPVTREQWEKIYGPFGVRLTSLIGAVKILIPDNSSVRYEFTNRDDGLIQCRHYSSASSEELFKAAQAGEPVFPIGVCAT